MTYKTTKEIAKEIRNELKQSFPKVKFSVVGSNYAGGSNVTVTWTDGPTNAQVKLITSKHEDITRDEFGEILSGGNTYIFTRREYSILDGSIGFKDIDLTGIKPVDVELKKVIDNVVEYLSRNNNFDSLGYNDKLSNEFGLTFSTLNFDVRNIRNLLEEIGCEISIYNLTMNIRRDI